MRKFLQFAFAIVFLMGTVAYVQAQTFAGSDACKLCHLDKYDNWAASGHPYKFNVIVDNQPPVYPPEAINFEDQWMDSLGDGSHDWSQIAGVIGGYGWKARFVGLDGHLVGTSGAVSSDGVGHNQFNFFGGVDYGWVDYHPNDVKIYNYSCFKCHTTGGDTTGSWLAGVDGLGTFTEGGIGCESCHGPGSDHVADPTTSNIDRVYEFAHQDNSLGGLSINGEVQTPNPDGNDVNFLCGTCHNRDYKAQINASGGFVKHHEQWDEFTHTEHYANGMTCLTCHDPHKRVIWDGDGIKMTCGTCHPTQVETINHEGNATCLDCHMTFAAKSGTTRGQSGYKGDVRSHLFKITVDTESMFTEDGAWVRDDEERKASLSPAYTCLGCHNDDPNDDIPDKTLAEVVAAAGDMHNPNSIPQHSEIEMSIYPNPTNGVTRISFTAGQANDFSLKIFNVSGQLVYNLENLGSVLGEQVVYWEGTSNTGASVEPGYYFVQISTGAVTSTKKLVLMK
ncbi:MAG: T9SS type A sorting domain-containing protein [Bacteroidales bacterium]|nr:T9SS type A sorting domain-containing protein [Bacteroidales bacterium]